MGEIKICEYGCNQEAQYQFKNGKWCCSDLVNRCPCKRELKSKENSLRLKKEYQTGKRISHFKVYNKTNSHNTKGWIPSEKAKENWQKATDKKKKKGVAYDELQEKERRRKISSAINKRYEDGWLPKAGRCKKIKYTSLIAGEVLLDGTWELNVAKYLDENKINWRRNKERFKYFDEDNNKERYYTPDFYLIDLDSYLEVKGHETRLDKFKWSQFSKKLMIWKSKELKELKII